MEKDPDCRKNNAKEAETEWNTFRKKTTTKQKPFSANGVQNFEPFQVIIEKSIAAQWRYISLFECKSCSS